MLHICFDYCKESNFNIHIWACFGYIHLLRKGNQVLFIIWLRVDKLFGLRKRECISRKS